MAGILRLNKIATASALTICVIVLGGCERPADATAGASVMAVEEPSSNTFPAEMVGTWGMDADQCAIFQEMEGAPMVLTSSGYDQHETHCSFDHIEATGDGIWTVRAMCSVQGDQIEDEFNLRIEDDHLVKWYGEDREWISTMMRCS
jgi:hypothetical protein